jgi:arylsulfatase A-like enzyme
LRGETLRSAQAAYYGLINHIDDQLYWLNREFTADSRRQKREWLIVYTTDHGEMLGDHYLFRKCEPYEGSARIPFLIQGSAGLGLKSGQTCESPVCLEDLMPTFLELAGRQIPDGLDGRSLAPILRGEKSSVRDVLHGEHATQYAQSQANHYLTDGRMKYIWRPHDGSEQLFDLSNDPHEKNDLASDARHADTTKLWRERLIERLKKRPEGFVEGNRLVAGRECPKFIGKPSD